MTDPSPEERAYKLNEGWELTHDCDAPEELLDAVISEIRLAVLAERERCAKLAEDYKDCCCSVCVPMCGTVIADVIRTDPS